MLDEGVEVTGCARVRVGWGRAKGRSVSERRRRRRWVVVLGQKAGGEKVWPSLGDRLVWAVGRGDSRIGRSAASPRMPATMACSRSIAASTASFVSELSFAWSAFMRSARTL